MKRSITVVVLIIALMAATFTTGCDQKGDPTGPVIFIAAVLILGLTVGGWFQDDHEESFPPDKYDRLPWYGDGRFEGSILSDWDKDWYRTELMRPGDRITIWSESEMGVRATLVDEHGKYVASDNYAPGSNFKIEIRATETMSYYLLVEGVTKEAQGPYTLYWQYGY
jgi:hypothetical protein